MTTSAPIHPALPSDPLQVTTPGGRLGFVVGYASDPALPTRLSAQARLARDRVALRLAGGCSGLDNSMKVALVNYCVAAFRGYGGVLYSGATRDIKDGRIDPMITDVAVAVRRTNPTSILLGSFPRTDGDFGLVGQSSLVVGQYNIRPNPNYDGLAIMQNGMEGELGWNGDLPHYFRMMDDWRQVFGFQALGIVAANGGAVTNEEIVTSAAKGYTTILIRGFGGTTDQRANEVLAGRARWAKRGHNVVVVDGTNPQSLRQALLQRHFLPAA